MCGVTRSTGHRSREPRLLQLGARASLPPPAAAAQDPPEGARARPPTLIPRPALQGTTGVTTPGPSHRGEGDPRPPAGEPPRGSGRSPGSTPPAKPPQAFEPTRPGDRQFLSPFPCRPWCCFQSFKKPRCSHRACGTGENPPRCSAQAILAGDPDGGQRGWTNRGSGSTDLLHTCGQFLHKVVDRPVLTNEARDLGGRVDDRVGVRPP